MKRLNCNICGVKLNDINRAKNGKKSILGRCKKCLNKQKKEYRLKNKERWKGYYLNDKEKHKERDRLKYIKNKKQSRCKYCKKRFWSSRSLINFCSMKCRFMGRVNKTNNCWNWTGGTDSSGYGSFGYKGKTIASHRISYELFIGQIPDGLHILHKCDNRKCVNPEHLWVGTNNDNVQDRVKKGRSKKGRGY